MNEPRVIFVVLNWNQAEMTAVCFHSLMKQDYSNFQVILVDNGSKDNSGEMLKAQFPEIELIHIQENIGYSAGNNVGIERALEMGSEYVFLINNDTEVDPGMLKLLVKSAETDPQIGIAGPTQYYFDTPDMIWGGANFIDWKKAAVIRENFGACIDHNLVSQAAIRETDVVDTCAALVKSEALRKCGGMDERYFINFDDHDLNLRVREAGFKVVYVPQARMWHKVSAAMGLASPGTTYYMTRNSLLFFYRHSKGLQRYLNPARILLRTTRTILAWSLKPKYRSPAYNKRRLANIYAIRDFFAGRYGMMGEDVRKACMGD